MQGHSTDLEQALSGTRRTVSRADIINDGKVTGQYPLMHDWSVTQDRQATNRGTFDVYIPDPDGTQAPIDMTSDNAPFGPQVQLYAGARLSDTEFTTIRYDAQNGWAGQFVSTKVDADGSLTLGP